MWNRIFDVDNAVFRAIDTIGKIFILNLYWVICSLPIFTIGASTSALLYASMKLHDKEGYVTSNFFSSFKENFKQATEIWLIYLVIGILLGFDFMMGNQAKDTLGVCMQGGNDPCYSVFFITALCVWCPVKIRESGERYDPLFLFYGTAQYEVYHSDGNFDDFTRLGKYDGTAC